MKYLKENETKSLSNREELEDYLQFRKKNDKWLTPCVRETAVVGFDPILSDVDRMKKDNFVDIDTDALDMAANDTALLLIYPDEFKNSVSPVRYTAFPDVEARSGIYGRTMERQQDHGDIEALSPIIKGQIFSTGLSLNGENGKLLIRDEMVNSFKSKQYQPFPELDMVTVLEERLCESFPRFCYAGGIVNHERLTTSYELNADTEAESLKLKLEGFGCKVGDISTSIEFTTSDVGNSAVSVYPYCKISGVKLRLGTPIKVRHDIGNTDDDFRKALMDISVCLQEAEEQIERLGNQSVKDIGRCIRAAAEEAGLPKTQIESVASRYDGSAGTAVEVYISLTEIAEASMPTGLTQIIQLQEKIARYVNMNISKYDL